MGAELGFISHCVASQNKIVVMFTAHVVCHILISVAAKTFKLSNNTAVSGFNL